MLCTNVLYKTYECDNHIKTLKAIFFLQLLKVLNFASQKLIEICIGLRSY